jgi:uncharacterized coiled-coil protein SlyX
MKTTFAIIPMIALACIAYPTGAQSACPEVCDTEDNTGVGDLALSSITTGSHNSAFGARALLSDTEGSSNTATGRSALSSNKSGSQNTAVGSQALLFNEENDNTAIGFTALRQNVSGTQNTAVGKDALFGTYGDSGATGSYNTATGFQSLYSNSSGFGNVADGQSALYSNITGYYNTATGVNALYFNIGGYYNTATGYQALVSNQNGFQNTACGFSALFSNSNGSNNLAVGANAGVNLTTGSNNIALGYQAGHYVTTGNNNIDIGNSGVAADANKIRIGTVGTQTATFIAGIYSKGVASGSGATVKIDSTGKLGTVLSSARYKDNIKPMDKSSEAILQLEPVSFRYKKEFDPDGVTQFGLIAEQVEKVDPNLIVRDEDGKPSTVRYEAVNAMLLNEFLKEHGKVKTLQAKASEQDTTVTELKSTIAKQQKQIEALTAGLQKVNQRIELNKATPRVAVNQP